MGRATLELCSPGGVPMTLHLEAGDEAQAVLEMLEHAEKVVRFLIARGWALSCPVDGPETGAATGPTFAGFPCSPTVDERGLPTWIIVAGQQAQRREKQGDVWYSVKREDGNYDQVLRIPRGEKAPPIQGL